MARSSGSFNKREKEKKRQQKQEEKKVRKEERKSSGTGDFDSMIAYVDENGQITSTPPDPTKRKEVNADEIELGVPRRTDEAPEVRTGRIDRFDESRGFGFIQEDGTRERYFVHVSALLDEVREGDKVTFDLERGPRGLNAVGVKKA